MVVITLIDMWTYLKEILNFWVTRIPEKFQIKLHKTCFKQKPPGACTAKYFYFYAILNSLDLHMFLLWSPQCKKCSFYLFISCLRSISTLINSQKSDSLLSIPHIPAHLLSHNHFYTPPSQCGLSAAIEIIKSSSILPNIRIWTHIRH